MHDIPWKECCRQACDRWKLLVVSVHSASQRLLRPCRVMTTSSCTLCLVMTLNMFA